ncbi:MAG: glycosyltransferase family 4 protein [candidate division NC10 bacterium]|nr:glycosyltransferase family 4 protein [candidate division NC10 bacterium]MDE2320344.1 glycosyltransferase family 4 protein [candidate division NC10 bacterium]
MVKNITCYYLQEDTALSHSPSILLLAPQLYVPGGIQTYMRRLREILAEHGELRGFPVHCLSLMDDDEDRTLHAHHLPRGPFVGCKGNKFLFGLRALNHGLKYRNSLVIVGHIGQVPVAWLMRQLGLIQSYFLVLYGIEAWGKAAWLDLWGAQAATCIVAITKHTALEFCKYNLLDPNRSHVIPPTLAEEKIGLPSGRQGLGDGLAILTVGRLSVGDRLKGIDTLIKAIDRARREGAKVHLTVAGDGDDLPRLKELTLRLELNDYVEFLGAVSDEKLEKLYQTCDVFAMPSKKEGFGIVFLEAMRFGKPCIGGNHGGTPEVITHGIDGYLVDHGDVDQLTKYLVQFSHSPELRREMGLRGYEKVKAGYLFQHMRGRWFALLDSLTPKC